MQTLSLTQSDKHDPNHDCKGLGYTVFLININANLAVIHPSNRQRDDLLRSRVPS